MKKILLVSTLALVPLFTFADASTSTTSTTSTGTSQTGVVLPPPPPTGSGGQAEHEWKGLGLAIGALAPADREALVKIIKDYLTSKGIDPAKYAEKRDEMKEIKKEAHQEIKDVRQAGRDAAKAKREEMKAKIETLRGHGKVNVQDISMMKGSGMGAGKATFKEFTVTK